MSDQAALLMEHMDEFPQDPACPKCGGRTYGWGDTLADQPAPPRGDLDLRERMNRTCISCETTWRQGTSNIRQPTGEGSAPCASSAT